MNQPTTQQQVCRLLRWSEEQHSNYIYQCGLEFLSHYLPAETEYMHDCIIRSCIYWNWWKLHWQARDQAFIEHELKLINIPCAEDIYKELHDPKALAFEIYPNGVVLSESYAYMIGELQKKEVAA